MLILVFRQAAAMAALCLLTLTVCYARGENEPVAAHIYRYKDAGGNLHIGRQIPPENYKYGYTALDAFGEVIKVVPPAPTEGERAAFEEELRRKHMMEVQREEDKKLIRAYNSSIGAENTRDRKLAQLDVMIDITRAKLVALQVNYDREVEYAAEMERSGKTPDRVTLKNMADIEESMIQMEAYIEDKEKKKVEIHEEYEQIITRLKAIEVGREAENGDGEADIGSSSTAATLSPEQPPKLSPELSPELMSSGNGDL